MTREQALNYMRSNGWSEEQINTVTEAFTCEDAISRQAAIRIAEQGQIQGFEWQFKQLVVLPSVSTEKTGRWIYSGYYECSECGKTTYNDTYNYCPNCGARMAESEDKE